MPDFLPSFDINPIRGKYPLDDTFSVDQLLPWHSATSPHHQAMRWYIEGQSKENTRSFITWNELNAYVQITMPIIMHDLLEHISHPKPSDSSADHHQFVIGVCSDSSVVEYTIFLLALLRLSHPRRLPSGVLVSIVPFLIEPGLSIEATKSLIKVMNVQHIYASGNIAERTLEEILANDTEVHFRVHKMPVFEAMITNQPQSTAFEGFERTDRKSPAVILHSGGSTSNPKPIRLTHGILIQWANSLGYDGFLAENDIWAVHGRQMFHAMGVLAMVWSLANRLIRAALPPKEKIEGLTPAMFLSHSAATHSTIIYTVPSTLEIWATNDADIDTLKQFKAIVYAGAALSKEAGTKLYARGVNIRCSVGATEYGQIIHFTPRKFAEGYEWFTLASFTNPHFEPHEEPNIFEIIFKQGPYHALAVTNTELDGVPAYQSGDLVERHPENPSVLRLRGRKDDQMALNNGEKVHPVPVEQFLASKEGISGAVIFGAGQTKLGVLIEPAQSGVATGDQYELIWKAVQEANDLFLSITPIMRNMILLSRPEKPFSYTSKQTARRGIILKLYQDEIKELYATVDTIPNGQT